MDYLSSLNSGTLDPNKPTLFELLAAKQLNDLLNPSIRYIIAYNAERHPRYLLKIANNFNEVLFLFKIVFELTYLKKWNGTFTENFYGIKRSRISPFDISNSELIAPEFIYKSTRLTKGQIYGRLIFTVVFPYIHSKIQEKYEVLHSQELLRRNEIQLEKDDSLKTILKFKYERAILDVYPKVLKCNTIISVAFQLLYLFGKSPYFSFEDMILGIKCARLTSLDYSLNQKLPKENPELNDNNNNFFHKFIKSFTTLDGLKSINHALFESLNTSLGVFVFLLKFIEWWSSSEFSKQLAKTSRSSDDENMQVPQKPKDIIIKNNQNLEENYNGKDNNSNESNSKNENIDLTYEEKLISSGKCYICKENITNPTAIETGYVFCYPCIYRYLQESPRDTGGRCPISGQRLLGCTYIQEEKQWEVENLRRIMV